MNWKEVLKVSGMSSVVTFILTNAEDYLSLFGYSPGNAFFTASLMMGVGATGFILNRRLKRKEEWGILAGMVLTLVMYHIIEAIVYLLFFLLRV